MKPVFLSRVALVLLAVVAAQTTTNPPGVLFMRFNFNAQPACTLSLFFEFPFLFHEKLVGNGDLVSLRAGRQGGLGLCFWNLLLLKLDYVGLGLVKVTWLTGLG